MTQPSIFCPECNNQILIIPDLKEMSIAIETHIKTHNLTSSAVTIQTNQDKIRSALHEQLLQKILIIADDKQRVVLEGNLGRFQHEGFYIQNTHTYSPQYINDFLEKFKGKNIKITFEEV